MIKFSFYLSFGPKKLGIKHNLILFRKSKTNKQALYTRTCTGQS